MIEYVNVSKTFTNEAHKITAVNDISLKINQGELVVLLGPSGCGKTTLLRLTNRLEELDRGHILINNRKIDTQDEVKLRQGIGYVIQEIGLFPNKTIGENIGMIPKVIGWNQNKVEKRIEELLEMMNLDSILYKDKYPHQLSGGQRQRIGVARALAANPDILLMDEPFGAIDPINRKNIQDQFLTLQKKLNKTIIFVSHDIHEALKMADKIAIINQGELIQFDTPENILLDPKNKFVEEFIGTERAMKVLDLVRVKEAMSSISYKYDDLEVKDALKLMKKNNRDYLLICSEDRRPLGYISREDILKNPFQQESKIINLIKDLDIRLTYTSTLKEALTIMVSNEVTKLCIVDQNGTLVGAIDFTDIQDYLSKNYRRNQEMGL
ncbi:betaine/proline/choline family ABC transporter ATP-binding protein [Orenia marismortui]|uniref:betaine/proline/choline family ABC transporter ATP-binding protein n=1 Tax=Orenia marismortui TaxID=46469 RepID=UPI000375EC5F|nr:betaine/proline/choline family ABC transporter ATP-binding protein [Orenia marismortui]